MSPNDMSDDDLERERRASAEALARVTEAARGVDAPRDPATVLGTGLAVAMPPAPLPVAPPATWNPPSPPDLGPVNASWPAPVERKTGPMGAILESTRAKDHAAQVKFNSDQVRFDNALVEWVSAHFAATHRHYDGVISGMQQRMDDIDARHRSLELEVVRHVHEMARRIDLVLGEGEKGRVAHEAALRSIRERLRALEEALRDAVPRT